LPLFPDAAHLQRAFRGEVPASAWMELTGAAAAMIPAHHTRRAALQRMYEPDTVPANELRAAVDAFTRVEVELAALATLIDQTVARILRGRTHVSGIWHTETVGLVVSRMAELWLNYLEGNRHEDAFWVARISDAYNCLITELTTGRRLPPDM
jgi:hypothetical protein